ncbi:MAG: MFS transporter small subunit, partial [Methylocella sp.]
IRPVHAKWHIEEEAGINSAARGQALGAKRAYGIGRGRLDAKALAAWASVGLPLAWGVWKTLENAAKIFQ